VILASDLAPGFVGDVVIAGACPARIEVVEHCEDETDSRNEIKLEQAETMDDVRFPSCGSSNGTGGTNGTNAADTTWVCASVATTATCQCTCDCGDSGGYTPASSADSALLSGSPRPLRERG
jgi:hypothetical protein